jgi:hypothetical protein
LATQLLNVGACFMPNQVKYTYFQFSGICWMENWYKFLHNLSIIWLHKWVILTSRSSHPLEAKQVSKVNLRSKQGGINFTPFILSLPYAKKKSHMDGGSAQKCLSVSVCLSVTSLSPIIFWIVCLIGLNFFFTKTRENVYLRI